MNEVTISVGGQLLASVLLFFFHSKWKALSERVKSENICLVRWKIPKMHNIYSTYMCTQHLFLCVQHGADPTKKNRDGNTPLDLVKDGDTDIQDLLRGDAALLDAAKKGCLARVKKLCSPDNVNCRDTQGRHSTPLHLAGQCST